MQQPEKLRITEVKEYYKVKARERNAAGELKEVEKNMWRYKEVPFVTGWARFGHYMLDRVFLLVVELIIGLLLGLIILAVAGVDSVSRLEELDIPIRIMFYLLVYPGYYLLFESMAQASPAKLILGRVVVDEYGNKPTFNQILGRSFARIVPFEAFSCFGTVGWHDDWSKTYVLRKKDLQELKELMLLQETHHLTSHTQAIPNEI